MKIYSIITARTSSSRFPGKILKNINKENKSIDILIKRAKKIGYPIILATTRNKKDNKLCAHVKKNYKIEIFRGSEKNKILRWKNCFEKFDIKKACMIDGDDICFDYNLYKKAIKTSHKTSIVFYPKNIITGCFLYTLDYENLLKIVTNNNYNYDSEMVEPLFNIFKIKKKILKIKSLYKNKKIRLTFDYDEDYKLLNIIFNKFKVTENTIKIINFLNKKKNISEINYFRENFFKRNQSIKIKKLIKDFRPQ